MKFSNQEITDMAFRNSYDVIINHHNAGKIAETDLSYFIHIPSEKVTEDIMKDMLRYFEQEEEYDKCLVIQKAIDDKNY